jgi:capsular exopolysaccharide synthesis family protein
LTIDQIASILWRRRLAFLTALLISVAAVVAVTLLLPKTYTATTTVYVGGRIDPTAFIDTGLLEQHTRTYANLAGNPNIADLVREELDRPMTRSELLNRMSFAPVERTPLLLISAQGSSPDEAQQIANVYADTFVDEMSELFRAGKTPAEIAISQRAARPSSPSRPNPPLYIGLGALLSIFIALAYALLRERLDTRVRVAPEDDAILGMPIMARIPRLDGRDGRSREVTDRFGVLKTNVDFFDENPNRVVLITSPGVSEGKSTTAANLAFACAEDGERVVVLEADLRRPGLEDPLALVGGRRPIGLSNYLAGAASEHEIISVHPEQPGISVIWSGVIPPNPTALLGSHRLDSLVAFLRLDFDRVIIDTCPISVGADASVIASRVDGTLYVIDEQQTKRSEAQAGLNQLRSVRARLLGVVLNRAGIRGRGGYYYYGKPPADTDAGDDRRSQRAAETFS